MIEEGRFEEEFRDLVECGVDVVLRLEPAQAWCVLGAIQLACRHPHLDGGLRVVVESVGRRIQAVLASVVTPAMAELAEAGWRPQEEVLAVGAYCPGCGSELLADALDERSVPGELTATVGAWCETCMSEQYFTFEWVAKLVSVTPVGLPVRKVEYEEDREIWFRK